MRKKLDPLLVSSSESSSSSSSSTQKTPRICNFQDKGEQRNDKNQDNPILVALGGTPRNDGKKEINHWNLSSTTPSFSSTAPSSSTTISTTPSTSLTFSTSVIPSTSTISATSTTSTTSTVGAIGNKQTNNPISSIYTNTNTNNTNNNQTTKDHLHSKTTGTTTRNHPTMASASSSCSSLSSSSCTDSPVPTHLLFKPLAVPSTNHSVLNNYLEENTHGGCSSSSSTLGKHKREVRTSCPTGACEMGEERTCIDPADRSVEHRISKPFRREIVMASPAGNEEEDWNTCTSTIHSPLIGNTEIVKEPMVFDGQPVDLILHVFSFLIGGDDLFVMTLVSRRWRELTNRVSLFRSFPSCLPDGSVNWINFQNMGVKNKGTEGTCYKCRQRSTGKLLAMKRARVYPSGEGVPYYMLRELAVLQGMVHKHIASLEMVSLSENKLHVFFPFVEKTLHDVINPTGDPNGGNVLPEYQARRLLHQLLDAIAYCHRRGVLHRNLKPKHLLISMGVDNNLDEANLHVSDFALVRATGLPRRTYTMEVVTLWYRPPEILMGVRGYSPAVDIWSVGCIFAEMAQGKPLFTGISEIDQLFQIFSKLSTPTDDAWPEFTSLPNYNFEFPNWRQRPLNRLFPCLSHLGLDLLSKMLCYDPDKRITAEQALRHPFFTGPSMGLYRSLVPVVSMNHSFTILNDMVKSSGAIEHVNLFHAYLRDSEMALCKKMTYFPKQKELRPLHRSMLVDWLVEVVDVFEMCLRTAFLAVSYTDLFLDKVQVNRKKFQLLGATCLHVASKCEDVSYIGVEDLAMCADNVYESGHVLKMEETLLNTLGFCLAVPTVLDFLNIFQEIMPPLPKSTKMLAQYFAELALQEYSLLRYMPSLVATCCISLSMYCFDDVSWTAELEAASCYKWKDLRECMLDLQSVYSGSLFSTLAVVKKRYNKPERSEVASLSPPARYNMYW